MKWGGASILFNGPAGGLRPKGFEVCPSALDLSEWRNEEDVVGWEGRQRESELRFFLSLSLLLCNAGIRACGSESAALAGPAGQGM